MSRKRVPNTYGCVFVALSLTILMATTSDAQVPRPVVRNNGITVNDAPLKSLDQWRQRLSETWHLGTYKPVFHLPSNTGKK